MTGTQTETAANGRYMVLVAAVASFAGLLFGFDTAVVNGGLLLLRAQFHLTDGQSEVAAASLLLGAVLGAAGAGWISDRFGRKRALLLAAVLFALSSIGAALPRTLLEFELARIIGGLGIGIGSTLAPLYISELASPKSRGRLVTLNQLAIVVGILASYFVCWRLASLGPEAWRWMFGAGLLPSVLLLLGLLIIPESPRWLVQAGRTEQARAVLERLMGRREAVVEISDIENAIKEEARSEVKLSSPEMRRPLLLALGLAVLQQITGINTVLYYGAVLFNEHLKKSSSSSIGANIAIGAVNLLGTIVALFLMDRAGRRKLLLWTSAGMALSLFAVAALFRQESPDFRLIMAGVLVYVACFAIGLGPVTWVYISELFPSAIRARAVSLALVVLWIACLVVTITFLTLIRVLGTGWTFCLYGVLSLLTFFFVLALLPETRGQSLEQISRQWYEPRQGGKLKG